MDKIANKERLQWQAEDDARVMATYQEIMADKGRMNRAVAEAKKQASNLEKRASVMRAAAGNKKSTRTSKK